jgi:hypothetical protein
MCYHKSLYYKKKASTPEVYNLPHPMHPRLVNSGTYDSVSGDAALEAPKSLVPSGSQVPGVCKCGLVFSK